MFRKVAEDKFEEAEQRMASQTIKKTYDGIDEATKSDSDVQSTNNRFKDHEPGAVHGKNTH